MSGGIPLAGRHPSVVLQCPQYFPQDGDRGETSGTVGHIAAPDPRPAALVRRRLDARRIHCRCRRPGTAGICPRTGTGPEESPMPACSRFPPTARRKKRMPAVTPSPPTVTQRAWCWSSPLTCTRCESCRGTTSMPLPSQTFWTIYDRTLATARWPKTPDSSGSAACSVIRHFAIPNMPPALLACWQCDCPHAAP